MKKGQVLQISRDAKTLDSVRGVKLTYAIAKNMKKINEEAENIQNSVKPSKEVSDVLEKIKKEKKTDELLKEEVKSEAEAIFVRNKVQEIIDAEFEKVDKKLFDERIKQIEEFNGSLKDEVNIEIHKIKEADLNDDLTAEQVKVLINFM